VLQWPFLPHWLFVTYRLAVAIYAVVMTILSIVHYEIGHLPWPVWLTNWSYFLLTCHLVCAAVIVVLHAIYKQQQYSDWMSIPCNMKFNWFLFVIACPIAIIVSLLYFGAWFPQKNLDYVPEYDINIHLINCVIVLLEFIISAFPVRLLHVVYLIGFMLVYVIFTVIYWSFDHANVLYPGLLDWNDPVTSVVVSAIVIFVGGPLMHLILFGIYQLRMFIYTRCVYKQLNESTSMQMSSVNSSSDQFVRH